MRWSQQCARPSKVAGVGRRFWYHPRLSSCFAILFTISVPIMQNRHDIECFRTQQCARRWYLQVQFCIGTLHVVSFRSVVVGHEETSSTLPRSQSPDRCGVPTVLLLSTKVLRSSQLGEQSSPRCIISYRSALLVTTAVVAAAPIGASWLTTIVAACL